MKQAVILAAGEGQRLRPFTVNRPKVMLTIAGKPILSYVIEALALNGIRDIVLVVGYRKEQIYDAIGSGEEQGVDIKYVTQEKQLGTAHALAQAKSAVGEEFFVLPGDNLIAADTLAGITEAKAPAVVVRKVPDPLGYGVVAVDDGFVRAIVEKPRDIVSNIVNTGIYALTREVFDFIEEPLLDIPDVLNKMLEEERDIAAMETEGTWLDIAYPWDILNLNDAVLRRVSSRQAGTVEAGVFLKGNVDIGKDTVIHSGSYIVGPVVIGSGCTIGPGACILPATSIGDNVAVSSFTEIKNSVIGDDVSIGSGAILHDSVVDKGCIIRERLTAVSDRSEVKVDGEHHEVRVGAMLGEGCELGAGVVLQPGTVAGNYCRVQPLKLIGGRLPDRSIVY